MKKFPTFVSFALLAVCQQSLAFSQYHATVFQSIAPFWGSRGFNRTGQFSGTDSDGNLVHWSSSSGTQIVGKPFGLGVSQGAQQALSENGDAAVVAGGLVTTNLFSYNHVRGWEPLPYSTDPDVLEMRFYGYSNNDIIAAEGARNHFPNVIQRYVRVNGEWQLEKPPGFYGAGSICSIDRDGNIFYGAGLSIIEPQIWKADGSLIHLSRGAYTNGQVWPLGSDANGRVYGSAWSSSLGGSIVTWDSWTSEPEVLISGITAGPRFSSVNDYGDMMISQGTGATTSTLLWTHTDGLVDIQSLLDNGDQFQPISWSYSFNNLMEVESFHRGYNQNPLLLRPVPEPSTLLLTGAGIGFLVFRRRRRNF